MVDVGFNTPSLFRLPTTTPYTSTVIQDIFLFTNINSYVKIFIMKAEKHFAIPERVEDCERIDSDVSYRLISKPNDDPDNPLFKDYDNTRVKWVQDIYKWLPPFHTDIDGLDVDESTRIVGVTRELGNGEEAFLGGIRLTPLEDLDDSLSWNMVEMIFEERTGEVREALLSINGFESALRRGKVYDITRAFPNLEYSEEAEETLLRLFGASKGYCDLAQGEHEPPGDYYWIFTLNNTLKLFLAKHDIPFIEVAEDDTDPNEWTRAKIMVVDMLNSYHHVSEVTPGNPSHQVIVDAANQAKEQLATTI